MKTNLEKLVSFQCMTTDQRQNEAEHIHTLQSTSLLILEHFKSFTSENK